MSGSLKTILRGSASRVNLPNAQSNDCGRSPTNDGNGNAASCDLSSGSLNAPPRVERPYLRSVVRARHQPRHRLPRVHRPYLHAHDPFPFLHGSFTDDIIPSISFASPTAAQNIDCRIMRQSIFPVVGSFFSPFLRSPMVMIRSPGMVLLLGFF